MAARSSGVPELVRSSITENRYCILRSSPAVRRHPSRVATHLCNEGSGPDPTPGPAPSPGAASLGARPEPEAEEWADPTWACLSLGQGGEVEARSQELVEHRQHL